MRNNVTCTMTKRKQITPKKLLRITYWVILTPSTLQLKIKLLIVIFTWNLTLFLSQFLTCQSQVSISGNLLWARLEAKKKKKKAYEWAENKT